MKIDKLPLERQQEGWLEGFNKGSSCQESEPLLPHLENEFDKDEWNW